MQQITSLVKLESLFEHCLLVSFSLFSLCQSVTVHSNDKDTLSLSIGSNHRFCVLFLWFFFRQSMAKWMLIASLETPVAWVNKLMTENNSERPLCIAKKISSFKDATPVDIFARVEKSNNWCTLLEKMVKVW